MIASDSPDRLGCEDRDACIKSAVTQHPKLLQELSNILESLASQRADVGSRGDDGEAGDNQDDDESNQEDERAGRAQSGADLLQTFVFSATLTLPPEASEAPQERCARRPWTSQTERCQPLQLKLRLMYRHTFSKFCQICHALPTLAKAN